MSDARRPRGCRRATSHSESHSLTDARVALE